ncbi:MAG: hypothetical protein ABI596_16000 [Pyrinomonadaceae bacterium]
MSKNERFNHGSVSQRTISKAYSRVIVPSYREEIPQQKVEPQRGAIGGWLELAKAFVEVAKIVLTAGDREVQDQIKSIAREVLQNSLGQNGEARVSFHVTFEIRAFGDTEIVCIDYDRGNGLIMSARVPNSPFLQTDRTYTVVVDVYTNNPEELANPEVLQSLKNQIIAQTNAKPESERRGPTEHDLKDMNDRIKGDAHFDKGYKDQIDKAEGRDGNSMTA